MTISWSIQAAANDINLSFFYDRVIFHCVYVCMYTHTHTHTYIHTQHIYIYTHTYIHTMEYYSAIKKNEIMPYAATWMDLTIAILSKVSQTEKEKYCMASLIHEI